MVGSLQEMWLPDGELTASCLDLMRFGCLGALSAEGFIGLLSRAAETVRPV
jgi:hypothetical protein